MKVLVVEDEAKVLNFLKKGLAKSGMEVDGAESLTEVFSLLAAGKYDAVVLDRLLGGVDAVNYLADFRKKSPSSKILVLSALSDVDEKVEGLSQGADDYLGKPFQLSELVARIRAICRREEGGQETVLKMKDLTIWLDTQRVERGGSRIDLTAKEYKLLVFLVKNPDKVFSKNEIISQVWEMQYFPGSNVVEVVINHLRNKVDKGFGLPLIHSKRGVGYWTGEKG